MTPAEQAALLAYQQEQQRAAAQNQQDQGGLLDALGKLALGAGAVAAGAYGARRLFRGAGAVAPSKVAPSAAEVRRAAGAVPADVARQQRGIELTRLARAERPQGVRQVDLSRLAGQTTELPASYYQRTPSTFKEFSQDPARALLTDPELLKYVEAEEAAAVMRQPAMRAEQSRQQAQVRRALSAEAQGIIDATRLEANTVQAAAQEDFANQYLRNQGYTAADTLVDQQQGRIIGQVDHFANAVNSAEDQTTGRVKVALQRNEDTNLAAIEMAEDAVDQQLARLTQQSPQAASSIDVDAAINQVASQLEDGLPVDQAEKLNIRTQGIDLRTGERFALTSKRPYTGGLQPGMELELQEAAGSSKAQGFVARALQTEREKIASELSAQKGTAIPSSVEKELAERFGRGSYEYGREYTKVKQAMEAGLEDPRYLEASSASALPKTRMIGGQEFEVGVKNIMEDNPELAFRKPFISEETAIASEQQFVEKQNEIKDWLGGIRLEVAPQINKLQEQQKLLGEQQNMLLNTLNKKPDAELGKQLSFVSQQMQQNEMQLNRLNNRLSGATSAAQEQLSELEKWTPSTLVDWSGEGTVVRPKRTAPDTASFEAEGGELSNIERGSRMAQPGPEDLEIVPGGLLSGGRAKVVANIGQQLNFDPFTGQSLLVPLTDPNTGEEIIQKLAGKRIGGNLETGEATIGVRGRGGSAGLGTKSSIGIYGTELSEYGTGAQAQTGQYTQEASQVPSLVNPQPVQRRTGGYFTYPQQQEASPQKFQQQVTPERLASVELSEGVRKTADPQTFLKEKMREAGISAIGQASPWPRRNR
jgi:hypothetical protein